MMKTKLKYALIFFVFFAGCNSDQYTKYLAKAKLKDKSPLVVFSDYLELCYAENTGAAFSILYDLTPSLRRPLLIGVPLAAVLAVGYFIWCFRRRRFFLLLPLSFIIAGATGNLLDRIRYGYVIDFIHFHIMDVFHWPVFNVADILLWIGTILLLVQIFFLRSHLLSTQKPIAAE